MLCIDGKVMQLLMFHKMTLSCKFLSFAADLCRFREACEQVLEENTFGA